jgi:pyruvate dehydrogenase E1 component alpha subunit
VLPSDLIAFEQRVKTLVENGSITGPVHLSGGNEEPLIQIFKERVGKNDWVFSTWRWHYHALLHGVPPNEILHHLRTKFTMNFCSEERHFFTSAIAGGILPIACGVAAGFKVRKSPFHVHCFVGDMTSKMGIFEEVSRYASSKGLPLSLYVEDNGLSTDTPTAVAWGSSKPPSYSRYTYTRVFPHMLRSPLSPIRKSL